MRIRQEDILSIMQASRKASGRIDTDGFIEGLSLPLADTTFGLSSDS